eukprot:s1687_g2.t1
MLEPPEFQQKNMEDWGWRIPFVIAIIPGTIATLGRRCMPESHEFLEGRAREQAAVQTDESEASESQISDTAKSGIGSSGEACQKMKHLISGHWATLLVGIGAVVAVSVLQYGGLIWCSVLLQKKGTDPPILLAAGIIARISSILLVPAVAWLGDRQGVAWTLFLGSSMLALLGVPLYMVMSTYFTSFEAVVASYGLGKSVSKIEQCARMSCGCVLSELVLRQPLFPGRGEFDMLQKVIERRGTPTEEVWKDVSSLPNFLEAGRQRSYDHRYDHRPTSEFTPHPQTPWADVSSAFHRVSAAFLQLLDALLALDPKQRPKAQEALKHSFFTTKSDSCEAHQLPFVKLN